MVETGAQQDGQLRRARQASGLTQTEVAERLAEIAWFRDRTRLGISAQMVSKWERGEKRPSRRYRDLLCVLYDQSPAALGLTSAPTRDPGGKRQVCSAQCGGIPWGEVLLALGEPGQLLHGQLIVLWETELLKRRELLKAMGLATVASTLSTAITPVARTAGATNDLRADPETLKQLGDLATAYQELYHHTAPNVLMAPISAHLRTVDDLLRQGTNTRDERRLLANHSQVAQLAGRLAFFDIQDPFAARAYFTTAYDAAITAGDPSLAAAAVAHLGFVSAAERRLDAAADHLSRAQMHAGRGAPQVISSWLGAINSEIQADAGDAKAALIAIDDAKRNLQDSASASTPSWFDFYDATRLAGFEGYALLRSGRASAAAGELQRALGSLTPSAIKQRTVFLTDLATANVAQGDVDNACDLAIQAATDLKTRSYATCVNRLRTFRASLRRFGAPRAVRRLDCAMAEL